jgi:L-asparaginase
MQSKTVILATGGTIAGVAAGPDEVLAYRVAAIDIAALAAAVPPLTALPLEFETVAAVDSKDMTASIWQRLAQRAGHHLARSEVGGVVITHGTDTLEETAYFLHRVLAPAKPLVLTGAMRPATALSADGPANLLDAVTVARAPQAAGAMVVIGGLVYGAAAVRKLHGWRMQAFSAGDAGPVGEVAHGRLRMHVSPRHQAGFGLSVIERDVAVWPRVDIVTSHAGADGAIVDALLAERAAHPPGAAGVVVAGTGNATVHVALAAALQRARDAGVRVWIATRCVGGGWVSPDPAPPAVEAELTPAQARVELLLRLLADGSGA